MSNRPTVVREKPSASRRLRRRLQAQQLTLEGLETIEALRAGLDRFSERFDIDIDEHDDTATGGARSVDAELREALGEAHAHLMRLEHGELGEELTDPEQLQRLLERTSDPREQEACRALAQLLTEIAKRDGKWLVQERKIVQRRKRIAARKAKARPAPGMTLVADPRRARRQQGAREEPDEDRQREQDREREDPNDRTLQIDLEDVHEIGELLEALGYYNANVPGEIPRTRAQLTKLIGLPANTGINTIMRTLQDRFEEQDLDPGQYYSLERLHEALNGENPREHSPRAVAHHIRKDPAIADAAEHQSVGLPEQVGRGRPWIPAGPGAVPRPQQPGGGFSPDVDRYTG